VAGLTLLVAYNQYLLQQLVIDTSTPRLEYTKCIFFQASSEEVIFEARDRLTEVFFWEVNSYIQNHDNSTYFQAVKTVLPLTITLPVQSVTVQISIKNTSEKALANRVRTILDTNRVITDIQINAPGSKVSIIAGGKNKEGVTFEVDRLVGGDTVTTTIELSPTHEFGSQLDQLVLVSPDSYVTVSSVGDDGAVTEINAPINIFYGITIIDAPTETSLFPRIIYIPARKPVIELEVKSDEGKAILRDSCIREPGEGR
jgi:hypothetical protein